MLTIEEKSSIRIRLEELYDIADKHLSQGKADMILGDIDDQKLNTIINKIKAIKEKIIKGAPFNTAFLYRNLGVSMGVSVELPAGCDDCANGYIMTLSKKAECVTACRCELGKYRHRVEKVKYYFKDEKTENQKIQNNELNFDVDRKELAHQVKIYGFGKCPF